MSYRPRKENTQSLGEVIEEVIKNFNMEDKLTEQKIYSLWGKIMGPHIEKFTEQIHYRGKKITVKLRSAPLREELNMAKTKIIKMINKEMGKEVVDKIYFR